MRTRILARNTTRSIMLVIASLLLTLLRVMLVIVAYPPYKLLEKTNRAYQEAMEETCGMLSL